MRFACSVLWQYQMDYFATQGVSAWQGQVPFFITSNPNIGISYAKVIYAYIKDLVEQGKYDASQPLYILELGTGAGKFSFYCLQKLHELVQFEFGNKVRFCYVMSDFTMSNVEFWQSQPQLRQYLASGQLDFACLDMTDFQDLRLINANKTLASADLVNGLMVLGNYIFDTVPHDAYAIHNGQLYEARTEVLCAADNLNGKKPKNLEKLEVNFKKSVLKKPYPEYNPALVQVLEEYKQQLTDTTVLIPIAGIKTLEGLAELSGQKLMLISTDKGLTDIAELEGRGSPHVAFHGSFSMMVNFHAMARYNAIQGGESALQPCSSGIKTVVLTRGIVLSKHRWLAREIAATIQDTSPAQFFHMHRYLRQNPINFGVDVMLPYLINSHWDPYVFGLVHSNLLQKLSEVPDRHLALLDAGMHKIANKIYDMPGDNDAWLLIAMYFNARKDYKRSLEFVSKSIDYKGDNASNLMLRGLLQTKLGRADLAIVDLQKAKAMTKDSQQIDQLLKQAQASL